MSVYVTGAPRSGLLVSADAMPFARNPVPAPLIYTRHGFVDWGLNGAGSPQTYARALPVEILDGDLMVLCCNSRGGAHAVTTPGWTVVDRVETADGSAGGEVSFLVAYRVRQPGDTEVAISRLNTFSILSNMTLVGYRTNRTGGTWLFDGSVTTRGRPSGDTFTANGIAGSFPNTLLLISSFAATAFTTAIGHKAISSSGLPYLRAISTGPTEINTRAWGGVCLAGWSPGVNPVSATFVDAMHLPEQAATGNISYTLADAVTPRIAVHHSAVVSAFRYQA